MGSASADAQVPERIGPPTAVPAAAGKPEKIEALPPPAPKDAEIARLIQLLGDDDFATREKASDALAKRISLPNSWQFREAFGHDDAEIVARIRKIWDDFQSDSRVRKIFDAHFEQRAEKMRPKGWPHWEWVDTAFPSDYPGREWYVSGYVQLGAGMPDSEGICKKWPNHSKGMKAWTRDTLQDPERWQRHVQWMREKGWIKGGEAEDEIMQKFHEKVGVPGAIEWIQKNHHGYRHQLDEELLRLSGVLPPKEETPPADK
jgi:hypothetical protein